MKEEVTPCKRAFKNEETGEWGPGPGCCDACGGWFRDGEPVVRKNLRDCGGNLVEELAGDFARFPASNIPTPGGFVPYIEAAAHAVINRLKHAGEAYGEEVLFLLNEMGAVSLVFTKASRLLWSYKQGKLPEDREDGWMDIAGYAILEMARQAYAQGVSPTDIDGLFDRDR